MYIVTRLPNINPKITPPNPPNWQINTDSIKNWYLITLGVAPTDFLRPISLVLSVTERTRKSWWKR